MKRVITAGLVQQSMTPDPAVNLEKTVQMIRQAASRGAQLVLLPELHLTPYFCQSHNNNFFDLAEPIPGPSTKRLGKIAKETGTVLICSLFEKRGAGLYHNTAAIIDRDGTIAGIYRKMHIPEDPGYHEKFYFTPGDLGFKPVETSIGKLGVLICWDQWFPEAARLMALDGADLLLYPTAIGWEPTDSQDEKDRQLDSWITIQRAHAIANGLPLLSCNRTGTETHPDNPEQAIDFWGNSFIAGEQGEFLAKASDNEEQILIAEIDLARSESVRRIWPFLRDRRIDFYDGLTRRHGRQI